MKGFYKILIPKIETIQLSIPNDCEILNFTFSDNNFYLNVLMDDEKLKHHRIFKLYYDGLRIPCEEYLFLKDHYKIGEIMLNGVRWYFYQYFDGGYK